MAKYPFYFQANSMDCGPACLRMAAKYYGANVPIETLRKDCGTNRHGTSLRGLSAAAEIIGFRTLAIRANVLELRNEVPLPCIVHWNGNHFITLYNITKNRATIADPATGIKQLSIEEFEENFSKEGDDGKGAVLLLETTPKFNKLKDGSESKSNFSYKNITIYLRQYRSFFVHLAIGLFLGSVIQLFFPFLTQSLIDIGVQGKDLKFVYLILIAQVTLFLGRTSVDLIKGWILLHLGARLRVSLISDFLMKLMNLPISYFDSKKTGELLQRIGDHGRIQNMLTNTLISLLFAGMNLIVFSIVLIYYNYQIALVYFGASLLYSLWLFSFLKRRKKLDHERFAVRSTEQSKVIELVNGMQEIKLHNAETQKRWRWEEIQARVYKLEMKSLTLDQTRSSGSSFLNELKNIIITILAAKLVIQGSITLGMMMAISYIIGQLNGPVLQIIGFINSFQDTKIAMERLAEIHDLDDEDQGVISVDSLDKSNPRIEFRNVSFRYTGTSSDVLKNINLTIEPNTTTAIVGMSGGGKTTLLKLLLKFYSPTEGDIFVNGKNLKHISTKEWRSFCGAVMQEGYIFNETIQENIAVGETEYDQDRLFEAAIVADIHEFVMNLPLNFSTKIGNEGIGLSTGQKQRILIARALYKNPGILLFDEATSSLDARTEKTIVENLSKFTKGRTSLIIAHRLSTVKNADKIIVLQDGSLVEEGNHESLSHRKGIYFELVKNQIDYSKISENVITA